MIQELFSIGPLSISPFGVLLVAAFLAAFYQLRQGMGRLGIGNDEDASAIVLAAGLGGIAGAKIYYAALYGDWRLIFNRSGLVWYGGFILATILILLVVHRRRLPLWGTLDAGAVALALGYGVGRIGCFLVGDDYGVPTDLPWGIAFENGLPPTTAGNLRSLFGAVVPSSIPSSELLKVHPTQLYETTKAFGIWAVGRRYLAAPRPGTASLLIFILLAIERFLIEFLRAKDDRFFGPLTVAQVISIGIVIAALVLWRFRGKASEKTSAKASA